MTNPTTPSLSDPNQRNGFNSTEIRARLKQYDRSPFLDLLAFWLECAPTEADIQALARKKPDAWVNAMSQIARTSGFIDKTELTHNINLAVGQMSDSQLEDRMRAMAAQLSLPIPIDVEFTSAASARIGDDAPASAVNVSDPFLGADTPQTGTATPPFDQSDPS